nr:hypothetical protein [Candidatus Sigynarchaeum springense]MDO8115987.1 hypothetical protein [Candidatus Sigynarchaeota archaeon]
MNESVLKEARGFVCLLGVIFIVLGLVIILVLPAVIPSVFQNGVNQNGWWLVVFGAIGLIISFWGGPREAKKPRGSP